MQTEQWQHDFIGLRKCTVGHQLGLSVLTFT